MRGLDPVVWDGLETLRGPWDWEQGLVQGSQECDYLR